jgi:hypothetical protein
VRLLGGVASATTELAGAAAELQGMESAVTLVESLMCTHRDDYTSIEMVRSPPLMHLHALMSSEPSSVLFPTRRTHKTTKANVR